MLRTDEDALVCDFAEYYHIYDWRSIPARTAATLAAGLRDTSRSMLKLAGVEHHPDRILLASILDAARVANWQRTENGRKGTNKPALVAPTLLAGAEKKDNGVESFVDGDAFHRARERIINGGAG